MGDNNLARFASEDAYLSEEDLETKTFSLLQKVRLEQDARGDFPGYGHLDSPINSKASPKLAFLDTEVRKFEYSAAATSKPWAPSDISTPGSKYANSRFPISAYGMTLNSDSPMSTSSPTTMATFSPKQHWSSLTPQTAKGISFSTSALSAWITINSTSPSVNSSTENTQTMTWTSRTPFKVAAYSGAQKENCLPNDSKSMLSPKLVPTSLSAFCTESPVSSPQIVFAMSPSVAMPPLSPASPKSIGWDDTSASVGPMTSSPAHQAQPKSDSMHVGCLVDLDGSFSQNATLQEDECTRTIRLEVQREMQSLGQEFVTASINPALLLDSTLIEEPISAESDSTMTEATLAADVVESKEDSRSVSSNNTSLAISSLSAQSVPAAAAEASTVNLMVKEIQSMEELADGILDLMCDVGFQAEAWLAQLRAMYTRDQIITLLQVQFDLNSSNISVLDESLERLMVDGSIEAFEVTDPGLETPVRLYRASEERFEAAKLHSQQQ